jgi:hypothetical protein
VKQSLVLLVLMPAAIAAQDTTHFVVFHGDLGYVATSGNTPRSATSTRSPRPSASTRRRRFRAIPLPASNYYFQEGGGFAFTPILPKRHSLEFDAGITYVEQKLLPDSTD